MTSKDAKTILVNLTHLFDDKEILEALEYAIVLLEEETEMEVSE